MQKETEITQEDTAISLEAKLAEMARELIIQALEHIENNTYTLTEQEEKKVTFAPKLTRDDGLIHWQETALKIYSLVRGAVPWPGAFTYYKGKLLKVHKARYLPVPADTHTAAGQIISCDKEGITVATGEGNLRIEELQIEAKRKMNICEFMSGHRIIAGEKFSAEK